MHGKASWSRFARTRANWAREWHPARVETRPLHRVEFIDGQVGSPSFSVVADSITAWLSTREVVGPALARRESPALVCYLAHHLGRVTVDHPGLLRNRLRAFIVGWEIEELSQDLHAELACADVLIGISTFNTDVFQRHFPSVPTITVPVCPTFAPKPPTNRSRWGVPDGVTVFLNAFQPASSFDRKNPIDVYDAFTRAFEGRDDVCLVFKVHGGFYKQPDEGQLTGEEDRARHFLEQWRERRPRDTGRRIRIAPRNGFTGPTRSWTTTSWRPSPATAKWSSSCAAGLWTCHPRNAPPSESPGTPRSSNPAATTTKGLHALCDQRSLVKAGSSQQPPVRRSSYRPPSSFLKRRSPSSSCPIALRSGTPREPERQPGENWQ